MEVMEMKATSFICASGEKVSSISSGETGLELGGGGDGTGDSAPRSPQGSIWDDWDDED